MTDNIFENIVAALSFTDIKHPSFKENLSEIIQMSFVWNDHTEDMFLPSWVSCLYESIHICTNKFTCPGWMFVPSNPHPKGNK